jgi:1,4-dihydroxy-2-naphthoyl-CoA synthase
LITIKVKALEEEIVINFYEMFRNNPIILDFLKSAMNAIKDGLVG